MITARTVLLAGALAIVSGTPALAIKCSSQFDKNHNGIIDKGKELAACVLHTTSAVHREFDKNFDGHIDPEEVKDMEKASLDPTYIEKVGEAEAALGADGGVKPEKAAAGPAKKDEGSEVLSGFMLRKAYEPIGVIAAAKEIYAAKKGEGEKPPAGALATFSYDFQTDTYVGTAAGVVEAYRAWDLTGAGLPPGAVRIPPWTVTNVAIHAGAEFDRQFNSADPSKDVDALTLRGGGEVGFQGPGGTFNFARFNIFDATDFSFDAQLVGAEAEYEPVYTDLAIGQFQPLGSLPVFVRWRPILHAEYQNVVDSGGSATLVPGDNYLFAGPVISGEMAFTGLLERLYFDATYWAMWDVLGNADPFQYFEIGANVRLDDKGHLALTARYRDGSLPKTRETVQDIKFGVSASF